VQQQTIRVTDIDSRRLELLIEGARPRDPRDVRNVEQLESHLGNAEILPAASIDPDVVTMNSKVQICDMDAHETIVFRVVFPSAANVAAGKVSVLAPLGMAALGRKAGEQVTWHTPGGLRRLRVERVLYQPEREGNDIA
jgi:regulator of nucleoside diphosphate kinase